MWEYNHTTTELTHYGILGMKWGVRRYQNPDGTLTEAGRKRYGKVGPERKLKSKDYYKERNALAKVYETRDPDNAKIKSMEREIREILNDPRYKFDADDGGGAADKASQKAAQRYMELEENQFFLKEEIEGRAMERAQKELLEKYGEKRIKDIQTMTNVKAGAAFVATLGTLVGVPLLMATRPRR